LPSHSTLSIEAISPEHINRPAQTVRIPDTNRLLAVLPMPTALSAATAVPTSIEHLSPGQRPFPFTVGLDFPFAFAYDFIVVSIFDFPIAYTISFAFNGFLASVARPRPASAELCFDNYPFDLCIRCYNS
jgi:hypothetical protein